MTVEVINLQEERDKRQQEMNFEDEPQSFKIISMSEGLLKEFLERYFIANNDIGEVAEIDQVVDVNIDKLYHQETGVEVGLISFTVVLSGDTKPTTIEVLESDKHIRQVIDGMEDEPMENFTDNE